MKIWLLVLLLTIDIVSGIRINEAMYNPLGNDNNKEFVEIIGIDNLTGYIIGDESANDTLVLLQFRTSNYSLVVEDGFDYSEINSSIYSVGGNIGNGLSNSGDTIYLYFNGTLVHNMSYDGKLANDNGLSLEYFNGSFIESISINGTPGRINSWELFNFSNPINSTNQTNNVSNVTNGTNNNSNSSTNTCNVTLGLELSNYKLFFQEKEPIKFKNTLSENKFPYIIEYEVVDLFGKSVRNKRTTTNTNEKIFTPKLDESDRAFLIRNKLLSVNCNNNASVTENNLTLIVKGEVGVCSSESLCEMQDAKIRNLENQLTDQQFIAKSGGGGGGRTETKSEIKSFYTRKKKYSEKIKVFSTLKGKGFFSLKLTSNLEEFNITKVLNSTETVELEVSAIDGRNLYVLELIDKDRTIDMKKLVVEFYQKEKAEEFLDVVTSEAGDLEFEETEKDEFSNIITGNVVYHEKGPDFLSILLLAFILITTGIAGTYAWKKLQTRKIHY